MKIIRLNETRESKQLNASFDDLHNYFNTAPCRYIYARTHSYVSRFLGKRVKPLPYVFLDVRNITIK